MILENGFSGEVVPADGSGLMRWGQSECRQASRDKDSDPPSDASFLDVSVRSCKRIFRTNQPGALLEEEFDVTEKRRKKVLAKTGENHIHSTCGGWSLTKRVLPLLREREEGSIMQEWF